MTNHVLPGILKAANTIIVNAVPLGQTFNGL
jgi:hypothetical protein